MGNKNIVTKRQIDRDREKNWKDMMKERERQKERERGKNRKIDITKNR